MSLTCDQLVSRHATAWEEATRHPFLEGCRTGTIDHGQFATWLVQDYLFVVEFTRFAARTLAGAPPAHFDVLLNGLTALRDELSWFRAHAAANEVSTSRSRSRRRVHNTVDSWTGSLSAPYPVQATAFWAIEAVYNHAWQNASPMVAPYDEFARRWGSAEFGAYVEHLRRQADEALGAAPGAEQAQAEAEFLEVLKLERALLADGLRLSRYLTARIGAHARWRDWPESPGVSKVDPRLNFPPEKFRLTGESRAAQSKNTSGAFPLTLQPIRAMLSFVTQSTKSAPNILFQRLPRPQAPGGMFVLGDFLSPLRASGGGLSTQAKAHITHPPFNLKGGHV